MEYEPVICRAIHGPLLHSGLGRILDAIDICQAVLGNFFGRVINGEFELHSQADIGRLLVTMARNLLSDYRRHYRAECLRRGKHDAKDLQNLAGNKGEDGADPHETLARRELVERLRQAMSESEWHLVMTWASGYSWEEIAAERGENPNALRMRLSRTLARARRLLSEAV